MELLASSTHTGTTQHNCDVTRNSPLDWDVFSWIKAAAIVRRNASPHNSYRHPLPFVESFLWKGLTRWKGIPIASK